MTSPKIPETPEEKRQRYRIINIAAVATVVLVIVAGACYDMGLYGLSNSAIVLCCFSILVFVGGITADDDTQR